jgi:hypothetical protein
LSLGPIFGFHGSIRRFLIWKYDGLNPITAIFAGGAVLAKACDACDLEKLEEIDARNNRRYTGLVIQDLRRSAIMSLTKAAGR